MTGGKTFSSNSAGAASALFWEGALPTPSVEADARPPPSVEADARPASATFEGGGAVAFRGWKKVGFIYYRWRT